jgi:8-oxo-dGTP pyrophosphatase MutT (NUDIX family)
MGRGLDADLEYFLAAAAAGRHAAVLAGRSAAELTGGQPGGALRYDLERRAVRVVLRDEGGRILLFRATLASRSAQSWWELPGGGIDPGEGYRDAAVREIREETGLEIAPGQVGEPRWRRSATWVGRGIRRLQHEVVVDAAVPGHCPAISAAGQTADELEEYSEARWWEPGQIVASRERFYPGRLPELLPAFLAGVSMDEPFERWN